MLGLGELTVGKRYTCLPCQRVDPRDHDAGTPDHLQTDPWAPAVSVFEVTVHEGHQYCSAGCRKCVRGPYKITPLIARETAIGRPRPRPKMACNFVVSSHYVTTTWKWLGSHGIEALASPDSSFSLRIYLSGQWPPPLGDL